jgi:hypothetical protein
MVFNQVYICDFAFRKAKNGRYYISNPQIKLDKHNVGYLPMKGDTLRTSTVEAVTKPNRRGPSAKANERCAASGTESRRKGSSLAAGPGKNAFHRRWPMNVESLPANGCKTRRRRPSRRATATDATPISGPPAHGRAFAALPAGSGLIAGSPEDKRPKISRSFQAASRNRDCCVAAGAGAAMNWLLYTKATAAEADCAAASGPSEPPPTRSATTAPATVRGRITRCIRPISRKTRPRPRGLRKNAMRARRWHKAATALRSLAERRVFSLRRREFFPSAGAEKPNKTAIPPFYRWEKFGFARLAPP